MPVSDWNCVSPPFGSGAGVVVLRRLEDALADGDHVYAVIKGSAVNNDGARKVGYLAPSVDGQAAAIAEALALADVAPRDVNSLTASTAAIMISYETTPASLLRRNRTQPHARLAVQWHANAPRAS